MHKNTVWLTFFTLCCAITLWYAGSAAFRLYTYFQLTAVVPAKSVDMDIIEHSSDRFEIEAHYKYDVSGHSYEGNGPVSAYYFLNRWSADEAVKDLSAKTTIVWYSPNDPAFSALRHDFPYRECFSALMLIGLLGYFTWLGLHVGRKTN
jgi:hypothetical protein